MSNASHQTAPLPEGFRVRAATTADVGLVQDLAARIWPVAYAGIITTEQIRSMLGWMYDATRILAEMDDGTCWEILEEYGEPIGYLAHGPRNEDGWKLHKLYLLPIHQGRGLSHALLTHVFTTARKAGAHRVWLQVNKANARALAAYRRAGFLVERSAIIPIPGGFVMDDLILARTL